MNMNSIFKRKKEDLRETKLLLNALEAQNNLLTNIENNSKLLNMSFLEMAKVGLQQNIVLRKVVETVTDYFSIQTEILEKQAKEVEETKETPADKLY